MQSEISGHIGGNGNFFCRKCMAGGTTEVKETDDGFHSLFCVRTPMSGPCRTAQLIYVHSPGPREPGMASLLRSRSKYIWHVRELRSMSKIASERLV